jgi:hypothetical protein
MRRVHPKLYDEKAAEQFFSRERIENGIKIGRPSTRIINSE